MGHADIMIVGAGVVGLAIIAKLVEKYPDYQVIVLKRNEIIQAGNFQSK